MAIQASNEPVYDKQNVSSLLILFEGNPVTRDSLAQAITVSSGLIFRNYTGNSKPNLNKETKGPSLEYAVTSMGQFFPTVE